MIPEKLIHYAAETNALIYALWALALIFFIALVNVSLMLGMAWMRDRTRKERDRRLRAKLAQYERRIAELEIENRVLAEFRKRAEATLNGKPEMPRRSGRATPPAHMAEAVPTCG